MDMNVDQVCASSSLSSNLLRCCSPIEIDESYQLFRQIGEQLEFSDVQGLTQH